jgi:hypothetical protein
MKVFLAHSFDDVDRPLVTSVERLLESHDVPVVTGRHLGGGALTPQVMRRIESTEALVALMTRRTRVEGDGGQWHTHPWVVEELAHARAKNKLTIPLVEDGVDLGGAYQEHERIELSRDDPLDALLALSSTLRVWRQELGWARLVQLQPDEIAHELLTRPELRCRYRLITAEGARGDWIDTDPIPQPSGTVVYVNGLSAESQFIHVQLVGAGDATEWYSLPAAQLIQVQLRRKNGSDNAH